MTPMEMVVDQVMSTVRRVSRRAQSLCNVESINEEQRTAVVAVKGKQGRVLARLLCVLEDNVKTRLDANRNATWRCVGSPSFYDVKAVIVFYSPAEEPGGKWEGSAGNEHKDDYRRMCLIEDVEPHGSIAGLYREIPGKMTEEAMTRVLFGVE